MWNETRLLSFPSHRRHGFKRGKNRIWQSVLGNTVMHTNYVLHGLPWQCKEEPSKSAVCEKRLIEWIRKCVCDVILVLKQRRGLSGVLFPRLLELLLPAFISENNASLIYSLWAWKIKSGTEITCSLRLEGYDTLAWRKRDTLQRWQWH